MFKSNLLKLFTLSLLVLLSACNSAQANQPAPVKDEAPAEAAAPATETQAEAPQVEVAAPKDEMAEKPAAEEVMAEVEEKAPATAEVMTTVDKSMPVDDEVMAATDKSALAVGEVMAKDKAAPAVEEAAMAETTPTEEESMKQETTMTKTGPSAAQAQLLATLGNQGTPPELFNEVWLNSNPLKLADLHGKVVIVEFWTFGCYNCKNVVPSLREWHQKYADEGLVIIGVHTPEFGYEREIENVKQALFDQDIPYVVAIDNDWQTWRAYNNRYWPAKYFIDKAGNLRHIHIGEGRYEQQEEIIKALLAEKV